MSEWYMRWALLGPGLTRHKTEVGPMAYAAESRRTQVTMSRLRLNTTLFSHGHYFKKTSPKQCPGCDSRATVKHLLIDCQNLSQARSPLINHCTREDIPFEIHSILSPPFPASMVLQFLKTLKIEDDV